MTLILALSIILRVSKIMDNYIDKLKDKALNLVKQFFNETDNDYGYVINSNKASLTMDLIAYLEYHLNKKGKVK
jgi:succinate dehydrogenase flavin-adding protein (antitoxin of CptAB toxin-antitoxin module)